MSDWSSDVCCSDLVAQRAVVMAKKKRVKSQATGGFSIACSELRLHAKACNPKLYGCQCSCHKRIPRLGKPELPAGFSVKRYPEPPEDALEALLRRLEAQG